MPIADKIRIWSNLDGSVYQFRYTFIWRNKGQTQKSCKTLRYISAIVFFISTWLIIHKKSKDNSLRQLLLVQLLHKKMPVVSICIQGLIYIW